MICEKCGKQFKPDMELERLMAVGQVARVCDACATQPAPKAAPLPAAPVDEVLSTLSRIDWFSKDHRRIRFMALPPKREWLPKSNTLRKPRKTDQHVFVISTSGRQLVTTPPIRINCNYEDFEKTQTRFRAIKTPPMWDAFTGVAKIDIPFQAVKDVERENGKITVNLKNGEYLCLLFS